MGYLYIVGFKVPRDDFKRKELWRKLKKVLHGKVVHRISRNRIATEDYELVKKIFAIVSNYGRVEITAVPMLQENEAY